jgi:hypothetical protein
MEGDHCLKNEIVKWGGRERLIEIFGKFINPCLFLKKLNGLLYFHTCGDCPDRLFRIWGGGGRGGCSSLILLLDDGLAFEVFGGFISLFLAWIEFFFL